MATYSHNQSDLMWPSLRFGPINLYSLPPAWRCCSTDGHMVAASRASTQSAASATGAQSRLAELLRNRG